MIRNALATGFLLAASALAATQSSTLTIEGVKGDVFATAGPNVVVALYKNGAEVAGNGYARATVATTTQVDSVTATANLVALAATADFTATGGDIDYDQVAIFASTARDLLYMSPPSAATIAEDDTLALTIATPTSRVPSSATEVISLEDYGYRKTDDATYDNTRALLAAIKARRAGVRSKIVVPPGVWRFSTADILSLLSTTELRANERIDIVGDAPELQTQGTSEWSLEQTTVFEIDLDDVDAWWLKRLGANNASGAYGPFSIRNIAFRVVSPCRGVIYLGEDGSISAEQPATRGVVIRDCSFNNDSYVPRAWGLDDGVGFVLDRTRFCSAIKLDCTYDVCIENVGIRNFWYGVEASRDDCSTLTNVRAYACMIGFAFFDGGVTGVLDKCYSEVPWGVGLWTDHSRVIAPSIETGYLGITPIAQRYDCDDSDLTWSIALNSGRLELANLPSGTTAEDYLLDHSIIEVTPTVAAWQGSTAYAIGDLATNDSGKVYWCTAAGTSASSGGPTGSTGNAITDGTASWRYYGPSTAYVPTRKYAIGEVDATGADIVYGGEDQPCGTKVTLRGIDTGLVRCFGVELVAIGDTTGIVAPRLGRNDTIGDVPLAALVPGKWTLPFDGLVSDAPLDTGGVQIIRHCAGGTGWTTGGVTQSSGHRRIDHPARLAMDYFPAHSSNPGTYVVSRNRLAPDGVVYKWLAGPAYGGVSGDNDVSAKLLYRRAEAADNTYHYGQSNPYVWRLADAAETTSGIPVKLPAYPNAVLKIRVYAPAAKTSGLRVWDGVTSHANNLAGGWETLTVTLGASATQCLVNHNAVDASSNDASIAWIGVTY